MHFFSNRLVNVSHPYNSYEYDDDAYRDEAYSSTDYDRNYGHGYTTNSDHASYGNSYENGYGNRYDDHYSSDSFYIDGRRSASMDATGYIRGNYSQRSHYRDSSHPRAPTSAYSGAASKVTNIAEVGQRATEVLVIKPTSFEEIPYIVQALREYKSVVLNLAAMSPEYTQRTIDFITGGTHAMDGNCERIGEEVFLFTPNCVRIDNQSNPTEAPLQS